MKSRIIKEKGIICPNCNKETQVRTHTTVNPKQLRQPFYYSKWFYCMNKNCRTKQIMKDEFKVINDNEKAREYKRVQQEIQERQQQMNFLRSI